MATVEEPRADQCWKAQAGEAWVARERELDVQLGPLGRAVIERLAPQPGECALDIGCGSGQTLLELAERVGERGEVLGVDISEVMVARARQRVRDAGVPQIRVEVGDAQDYVFPRVFDLAFSRLGVMFFREPVRAFQNVRQALRPGGRLGFVCFQARARNEWAEVLLDAVLPLTEQELPAMFQPDRPGPFYFGEPERIRSVLTQAGFESLSIEPEERELHLGGAHTLQQAVDYAMQIGPAARVIAEAGAERAPVFRAALEAALARFVVDDGVWLGSSHFYVSARRGA
jgi:ubiquinone/menaquinone biosynthesis C-methylase UbiE